MQMGLYRKTVMKSLDTKRAKIGLKMVAKSNTRTNIALASVGFTSEVGKLLHSLTPYILGLQFTPEMRKGAETTFGQAGYHLTILCRLVNVKTPQATKNRSKLIGTRTANLMHLMNVSTDMLRLFGGTFEGPPMQEVERLITLPKQGGKKEMRMVRRVDLESEKLAQTDRQRELKSLVTLAVDLYWRLCVDIFQVSPSTFFAKSAKELQAALDLKALPPKPKKVLSSKASVEAHPAKKMEPIIEEVTVPGIDHIGELAEAAGKVTGKSTHGHAKNGHAKPVPPKPGKAVQPKPVPPKKVSNQVVHA